MSAQNESGPVFVGNIDGTVTNKDPLFYAKYSPDSAELVKWMERNGFQHLIQKGVAKPV